MAFSPGGRRESIDAADKAAILRDSAAGNKLGPLAGRKRPISSVAFYDDGRMVDNGASDHTATLWDAATGNKLPVLPLDRD